VRGPHILLLAKLTILWVIGQERALSAPITIELNGGSVIKGDLISWNRQEAVVKAELGSMTFKRDQLSQTTLLLHSLRG
jgi:hypothetical protein